MSEGGKKNLRKVKSLKATGNWQISVRAENDGSLPTSCEN